MPRCACASGVALLLVIPPDAGTARRRAARGLSFLTVVIGLLTLGENLIGWNLGIDQFLAEEAPGALGIMSPNRMGTPAAASLVLAALSVIFLSRRDRRGVRPAQWAAIGAVLIVLPGTLGYVYGVRQLYMIARVTAIAWPTAAAVLALGLGLLCARPSEGVMSAVTANDGGGRLVRRMLPACVGLPFLVGYLRVVGERLGVFDAATGTALVMLLVAVAFSFLVYGHGRGLSRREASDLAAQEALGRVNTQLELALRNAPVSVAAQDRDLRYIWAYNQRTVRPEEIVGHFDHEIFTPEEAARFTAIKRRVLEEGTEWREQLWVERPRGRSFLDISWEPIRDPDGKVIGVGSATVDLTPLKLSEEALRESEASNRAAEVLAASEKEFRLVAEAMPQIVWTTRSDGWSTYTNHQWVDYTGLTLEESYGHGWNKPFHPEDQQRARDAWQHAVTNRASYSIEGRLRRADGVYRWWLIRGVPVLDENGDIHKWIGTCTDIDDLKRAEQALRQANADLEHRAAQLRALAGELTLSEQRERSRLAKVLHDHLQQLLVGAKFRLSILGRHVDPVVQEASKEIEQLMDESIQASRSLTAELSPSVLHESGLTAGLGWLARWMADKHGLVVDLSTDGDLPPVTEAVKVPLFESVRELLFNAVKHAHAGSASVSVRCPDGGQLRITVSDDGSGFDPGQLKAVGKAGRGFGLFSIRERLDLIGGRMEIDSALGNGSRFMLTVPFGAVTEPEPTGVQSAVPKAADRQAGPVTPGRGDRHPIRVLLADDHAVVREGLARLLGQEPDIEIVGEAADGQEAIEMAPALLPDLILMDVSMPKLNGVEATRAIVSRYPGMRVIGLSMFEELEHAQAMLDAGAVKYLTKSEPSDAIVNAVRACAARVLADD